MPIHDWTRVTPGTWHAFHVSWIAELQQVLNDGRMPPDYYAQAEQIAGPLGPDVLTLQESDSPPDGVKPETESGDPAALPADEPLTLAASSAGPIQRAYVEPTAVGRPLIDMPLFLDPEWYVSVPLEGTYQAAYCGVPRKWREVLEGPPAP